MDNSKAKCLEMIVKLVETSLNDHYSGDGHRERCKNVLALDAFAHLKDQPNGEKINDFVALVMQRIAKEQWSLNKKLTMEIITAELKSLIEDLLTDDEAAELYTFGSSQTGQKVFRNLDLMKAAIAKGRNIMTASVIGAWSQPEVDDEINGFIQSLNETQDEDLDT
jgi:hypothetical protein